MDLNELKKRFKHKTKADLKDIDIALQAVPFLVRKLEELETELSKSEERIFHLTSQMKKRPPLSKKGKKGNSEWEVHVDEKKNRLNLKFKGEFDYKVMKLASNNIMPILPNIRKGCDVINDIGQLSGLNNRVKFHFKKIMYTLEILGVGRVIYILQESSESLENMLKDLSQHAGYQVYTVKSFQEADDILEKSTKFLKA
jgi:hypothetical protein